MADALGALAGFTVPTNGASCTLAMIVEEMRSGIRHCTLWLIMPLLVAPLGHTLESATLSSPREYRLRFYHTHTNERLDIVYRRSENYLPEALAELDHYLRDHRTGEVRHFDPHLFDLLYDLTASVNDSGGEIECMRALPAIVFTSRRKPSTFAYWGFRPRQCGMPRCACNAGELVTIAIPTSSMWTWDACAAGNLDFTRDTGSPCREPAAEFRRARKYRRRSEPAHLPAR